MRARGGWGPLLLVTIATLASPALAATKAEGSFTAQGAIAARGEVATTLDPLGLLARDTTHVTDFLTTAPRAEVCVYEETILEVVILRAPERKEAPRCATHRELHLEQADDADSSGWLGLDPDRGSLTFSGDGLTTEERESHTFTSARQVVSGEDDQPFFLKRAVGPLLYAEMPETVTFTGGGTLKLMGLDLWLTSDGNRSKVETGEWVSESNGMTERFRRWAVVTFDSGSVTLATPAPLQVAARKASVSFTGDLHMTPTSGTLRTGAREYPFTGKPETVTGSFSASFLPRSAGAIDVTLAGELESTSLAPVPVPLSKRESAPWGLALVVGAVVVGGAAAVAVYRRRHPRPRSRAPLPEPVNAPARVVVVDVDPNLPAPPPETPEEAIREEVIQEQARALVERGRLALGASNDPTFGKARLEDAAYFFQRAWQLYPCLGEAAWGLGLVRFKEGNWRSAITQFLRASCYIDTGEPEVMCARGALRLGEEKAAGDFLHAALYRTGLTPSVFEDVYQDAALRAIIDARPDMAQVWQEALDHFYPEDPLPEDGAGPRA